jgi:hypothetical protein
VAQLLRDPGEQRPATADLIRALNSQSISIARCRVARPADPGRRRRHGAGGRRRRQGRGGRPSRRCRSRPEGNRRARHYSLKQADAAQATIGAALKSAPAKRTGDSDSQLGASLETATAQFKTDQKRAKEIQSQLASVQKHSPAELECLRKILAG